MRRQRYIADLVQQNILITAIKITHALVTNDTDVNSF